jgi:hypothetical protein
MPFDPADKRNNQLAGINSLRPWFNDPMTK